MQADLHSIVSILIAKSNISKSVEAIAAQLFPAKASFALAA